MNRNRKSAMKPSLHKQPLRTSYLQNHKHGEKMGKKMREKMRTAVGATLRQCNAD